MTDLIYMDVDFTARVINTPEGRGLFNKIDLIELSVYSAPPRPFICLLALRSLWACYLWNMPLDDGAF